MKVNCPVCRLKFAGGDVSQEDVVVCTICGARLQIDGFNEDETAQASRYYYRNPETEIRDRVDNFAELKGYVFNEDKEDLIQGLLEKNQQFGDLYCPCRFENVPENICPCVETRQNAVKKEGNCL